MAVTMYPIIVPQAPQKKKVACQAERLRGRRWSLEEKGEGHAGRSRRAQAREGGRDGVRDGGVS